MRSFLLAVQFLTILPVRINNVTEEEIAKSVKYFPLVGLFLGLILSGLNNILTALSFSPLSIEIILVISLVILIGGLHLDGLSDAADGFLSRKPKDEMLSIMRDSHAGVMGVLAVICVILLKISALHSVDMEFRSTALILMCILSRWGMVLYMRKFPYAR